jgi:ABC-2 type transport system permease protein
MAIWSVVGVGVTVLGKSAAAANLPSVDIPFYVFVYFIVFFVLGFLFYASIFTVVGAICSTEQDAQQLQSIVTLPMIVPILVLMLIVESPNSTLAVVLSLFPPFTPMIMLGRIVVIHPASWEIVTSIGLLAVSIYLAIAFSARVFRVGILMYGKRPSPREVIRWYRSAG